MTRPRQPQLFGNGSGPPRRAEDVPVPQELNTADFRAAWRDWISYRRAMGWTTKPVWAERQLVRVLAPEGPATAIAALEQSMDNGWQGVFPEKVSGNGGSSGSRVRRNAEGQVVGPDGIPLSGDPL